MFYNTNEVHRREFVCATNGVSRKIEDDEARRRLRDILRELNPPKGLGFIVRTAGTDRTKKELSRDLAYLVWIQEILLQIQA